MAYPGYRSMSYGVGPRKNTEGVGYIAAHARWINLGFYRGVELADPHGLDLGSVRPIRDDIKARVEALLVRLDILVG